MKYKVNDSCIGCGLCESTCPEVFHIEGDVPETALASAAEAKEGCPVGAIEEC